MNAQALAERNLIVRCRTGSHAYGMATPTSDLDIRGVFAGDPMNVVGPFFPVEQVEGEGDMVLFELSKYARLISEQNPTLLELMWVEPEDVLHRTPAWEMLRGHRHELLTRTVKSTYGGYAVRQLKDMTRHSRWLNNPQPDEAPKPRDFVSMVHNFALAKEYNQTVPTEGTWVAANCGRDLFLLLRAAEGTWFDEAGGIRAAPRDEAEAAATDATPVAIFKFNRDEYQARKKDHENYWTWKRNRNPERGRLEAELGYDAKNGAHLIRLMRMGIEALTEGEIRVRRPDAAELLAIRRGEVPYERVLAMAEELEGRMNEAEKVTSLPASLDKAMLGEIVMEMYEATWSPRFPRHTGAPRVDPRGRVVVVDVEGTGLHTDAPRVVEIAAVEIVGGMRTGRTFHAYVDPDGPVAGHARRIHGLTRVFLRGKPRMAEVGPELLTFVGDAPIVAHSALNDAEMLNHDLKLAGLPQIPATRFVCSQRMGGAVFGRQFSLDTLCDALEVERDPRERGHSASVDAELLADCVLRMAALTGFRMDGSVGLNGRVRRAMDRRLGNTPPPTTGVRIMPFKDDRMLQVVTPTRTWTHPVPPFPADTHRLHVPQGGTAALIVRKGPDLTPDNPLGPAILTVKGDRVIARRASQKER